MVENTSIDTIVGENLEDEALDRSNVGRLASLSGGAHGMSRGGGSQKR